MYLQEKWSAPAILVCMWCSTNSVAMAMADIFQNNRISVGRNLAKISKIFEKIDEAKAVSANHQ
jgi:hypothetical protein